ncbi:hypothetical protein JTE90_015114 [Oedothorax gibbosus]|uniref:Complex I-15 kDa n=1 Tax=Oedothorax gibbosus TaxID=931172 RepID=A0AAV6VSW1_9ARAC|nr:hypothetical protein JTE90_015114 [Oedothorax gibbosus]
MDCTDVYGKKGLMQQCLSEYQDLMECMFHKKQLARVEAMKKERMRQYMAGERSKKDFYAKDPLLDSYYETYQRTID